MGHVSQRHPVGRKWGCMRHSRFAVSRHSPTRRQRRRQREQEYQCHTTTASWNATPQKDDSTPTNVPIDKPTEQHIILHYPRIVSLQYPHDSTIAHDTTRNIAPTTNKQLLLQTLSLLRFDVVTFTKRGLVRTTTDHHPHLESFSAGD